MASYAYDALGRRISKTTYPPAPSAPVTTRFVHDPYSEDGAILEFRRDGVVAATFYSLPEVDDEVLVAFTPAGAPIYFHGDDLGNTLALTGEAGDVLERYDYDDYGSPHFLDSKGAPILANGQVVSASPLGNPLLFHGMFWDAETALYHDKGMSGSNPMYEPKTGRYMGRGHRDVGGYRAGAGAGESTFAGDNPWTGGSPAAMKKGTVKFFNEIKSFGILAGGDAGGGDAIEVLFNPKEYTIRKVTVRGWDPKKKEEIVGFVLKKEAGGRHTPFHNKYRPQSSLRTTDVTGEITLESGREMTTGLDVEYRLYGPGQAHWGNARMWQPGCPVFGNRSGMFSGISNMLKTKHDTAKNSVGNIR